MPTSLADWDAKHRGAEAAVPQGPAAIVQELLPLLPTGPALDLACGTGRHTLLLASRRQPVTAVDGSGAALEILQQRAQEAKYPVTRLAGTRIAASHRGIQLVQADLEAANLPRNAFALILCVNYLQRSLFAQMERALLPGGMLLFETYTRAQLAYQGGPRGPQHLLDNGELRVAFPSLRILFYRELRAGKAIASLLAQREGD